MNTKDIFIGILIAFIWGTNYVAMKISSTEMPGFLASALRFLLTAAILIPFATSPKIPFRKLYFVSLTSGAYIGLIYYSLYLGLDTCLGILLMQLNAPFAILIARVMLKEKFNYQSILGILIAFIGIIIILGAHYTIDTFFGIIIMLLAAFFCGLFSIQTKELNNIKPLTLIFWTSLIAAPHLFLASYFLDPPSPPLISLSEKFWWSMFYSIVVSCVVGIALRIYLLRKYFVHKVVSFNLLIPFFGVASSIIYEQHIPSWHIFLGGIIITLGIAITQIKSFKKCL